MQRSSLPIITDLQDLPSMRRCSTINVGSGKETDFMRLKKITENALQWLFTNYLKWIERTVTIRWDEENRYGDSQIFGFWHEDSFFMNLVLENLAHKDYAGRCDRDCGYTWKLYRKHGKKVWRQCTACAGRV